MAVRFVCCLVATAFLLSAPVSSEAGGSGLLETEMDLVDDGGTGVGAGLALDVLLVL